MAPGASGGPGSSSAPGSRIQNAQPVDGVATTDADIGKPQRAALPAWIRPAKWVQCQQGRTSWRCGLKWLVVAGMREASLRTAHRARLPALPDQPDLGVSGASRFGGHA
jgi:hypothetical protein